MLKTDVLPFTPLTAKELPLVFPYLTGKFAGICDMSLLYFHMWGGLLHTEYAFAEEVLFLRRNTRHGTFYYPPLVLGEDRDFKRGFSKLSLLGQEGAITLGAMPETALETLKGLYTLHDIATSRTYADYLYAPEDLATLAGKRYSKKRNLVHQFEKLYPEATYESMNEENAAEAAELLRTIMKNTEMDANEIFENKRVLEVLADYRQLPLLGGLVRVAGVPVAFAVGEVVDGTLYVHIEKADRAYKGAYQYINRAFVRSVMQGQEITLVNREDDSGDEGLRQAKLSYFPVGLGYKYRATVQSLSEGATV